MELVKSRLKKYQNALECPQAPAKKENVSNGGL